MKKALAMMTLVLVLGWGSTFANNGQGISKQTVAHFSKDFAQAKKVNWIKENGYSIANFVLDGQILAAYYGDNAELIAVVHNILADRLPIFLLTSLKSSYQDYWVSNLFESANENESSYHLTLENANQVLVLRSVNSTDWIVVKKEKKNLD
jgi:hypothetical protein